jgi:uncharacterized protein YbjT (DUF2867 family)
VSTRSFVIGATGIVGGYIMKHLVGRGERPMALSRAIHESTPRVEWFQGNLNTIDSQDLPAFSTIYCTGHANALLLAQALPRLAIPSLKRTVVFTSTSIMTKLNSEIATEREFLKKLADAETQIITTCERLGIGWTVLRPTIIYAEDRDDTITRLANLIRRFGVLPLAGNGSGLRQPVHAEDLAIGAIAAASSAAAINKTYVLPGDDTMSYREMVGRIFDALHKPRRIISTPPLLWRAAFTAAKPFFPDANAAMGTRMAQDMAFDASPAQRDFGWNPREFRPRFR